MLRKVFKYDFKTLAKQVFPLLIIMLALGVFALGISFLGNLLDEDMYLIGSLLVSFSFVIGVAITVLAVVSLVAVFYRYFKSVFMDEGYLTNVLPLAPHELFFGKLLAGVLLVALTALATVISAFVGYAIPLLVTLQLDAREIFGAIGNIFSVFFVGDGVFDTIMWLLSALLGALEWVILVYTAITLGSLVVSRHRILGSLLFIFLLTVVEEMLTGGFGLFILMLPLGEEAAVGWTYMVDALLSGLVGTGLCFLSLHVFGKRFNIE